MKLSNVWLLYFVGLLSFTVMIILLSFYLFTSTSESSKSENNNINTLTKNSYLYQEFDPSSNQFSSGFVSLSQSLTDDEFITYPSPNGNQIVISNFASSQFKCQGTCFCSSEKRRIASSPQLSLPLLFVISAISSSLALKIAEKSFRDQCLVHFSSTCDEEKIQSSVSSCSEKEEKEYAEYDCEGYCIPKKFSKPDAYTAQEEFEKETGGCEKLKTSGTVIMERKINEKGNQKKIVKRSIGEVKIYPERYKGMHLKAQYKFSKDYLTSFCKRMSQRDYWYHKTLPSNPKFRQRRTAAMCSGGGNSNSFPDERLEYQIQNVKCVMTSENKWGSQFRNLR